MKNIFKKLKLFVYLIIKKKNELATRFLDLKIENKKILKQITINGYNILISLNDGIGKQLYCLKKFEPKNTAFIKKYVKDGWVSLDIGANIGYYSLLLSKLSPSGSVYSFEPNEISYHLLSLNIYLNSRTNVFTNQLALGDKAGEDDFFITKDTGFSSFKDTGRMEIEKKIKVSTLKLDDFVEKNKITKIDFIKIDVEGAEKLVLEGAEKLLANLKPKLIMVEICKENLDSFNIDGNSIVNFLSNFDYKPYILNKFNEPIVLKGNDFGKNSDVYFINKEYEKNFSPKLP